MITASINDALGIRTYDYTGELSAKQFHDLANHYQREPAHVNTDLVTFLHAGLGASADLAAEIPAIRAAFRELNLRNEVIVVRRSLWVCAEPRQRPLVEAFLRGRHSLDGQGVDSHIVDDLNEALGVFEADELQAIAARDGFEIYAEFAWTIGSHAGRPPAAPDARWLPRKGPPRRRIAPRSGFRTSASDCRRARRCRRRNASARPAR